MEEKRHYTVVTGGTSGIGYELTRLLAKDEYNRAGGAMKNNCFMFRVN
jgi:short-subunit dehydrogenase